MNLLITGSTGFVGRNLLLHTLQDSTFSTIILPVRNKNKLLKQLEEEGIKRLPEQIHLCSVQHHIWNLEKSPQPDLAIHCAGLTFSREKESYFQTHLEGTLQLLNILPKTTRLIVLSSLSAAGPTPYGCTERQDHHEATPVSWYGESKLKMEEELLKRCSQRLLLLRPPMVLGPRDTATIPLFNMVHGGLRIKPGLQPKHYSWIDVDDLCRAILTTSQSNWPTSLPYFLTSDQTITDLELLATTAAVLKTRGMTLRLPQAVIQWISFIADQIPALHQPLQSLGRDRVKEILPQRWVADGSKFRRDFEWKPKSTLRETLERTALWMRQP
jgi:nucleoside-diphosphate-sugar epimerase